MVHLGILVPQGQRLGAEVGGLGGIVVLEHGNDGPQRPGSRTVLIRFNRTGQRDLGLGELLRTDEMLSLEHECPFVMRIGLQHALQVFETLAAIAGSKGPRQTKAEFGRLTMLLEPGTELVRRLGIVRVLQSQIAAREVGGLELHILALGGREILLEHLGGIGSRRERGLPESHEVGRLSILRSDLARHVIDGLESCLGLVFATVTFERLLAQQQQGQFIAMQPRGALRHLDRFLGLAIRHERTNQKHMPFRSLRSLRDHVVAGLRHTFIEAAIEGCAHLLDLLILKDALSVGLLRVSAGAQGRDDDPPPDFAAPRRPLLV